jgi:hypothetical protein
LVLLCRRHHRALHSGHWTITITEGRVQVSRPSWADPPPQPIPSLTALLRAPGADNRPGGDPVGTNTPSTAHMASAASTRSAPRTANEPAADVAQLPSGWAEQPAAADTAGQSRGQRAGWWIADAAMRQEASCFAEWNGLSAEDIPASQRRREYPRAG